MKLRGFRTWKVQFPSPQDVETDGALLRGLPKNTLSPTTEKRRGSDHPSKRRKSVGSAASGSQLPRSVGNLKEALQSSSFKEIRDPEVRGSVLLEVGEVGCGIMWKNGGHVQHSAAVESRGKKYRSWIH